MADRAQIDCLRTQMSELAERAEAADRQREQAERELDRVREGIGDDADLVEDGGYRRTQLGLRALALLGSIAIVVALVPLFERFFSEPYFTWQGIRNLAFHFQAGDGYLGLGAAGAVVVLASPWLVLPWLGALGLRRLRRWGWVLANVSAVLYLLTPLMPVSIYAMTVLWSGRVRSLYFPR